MTILIVAVLDTNVLVSALCLPGSLPAELLRRWLVREYVLLLSEHILAELADVLRRPKIVRRFGITEEKAQAFVEILRDLAQIVPGMLTVEAVRDDPKDNPVVACALEGNANFLVSGDRHLKNLGQYEAVRIISPAEFRAVLVDAEAEQKKQNKMG
jgi:putative PIN family toxin of toxin-antitoxin system